MRPFRLILMLALLGSVATGYFSAPSRLDPQIARQMAQPGDAKAGEVVFWAAGCASCHANAQSPTVLAGGAELKTPFGGIWPPNISPDAETGLGKWSGADFARAVFDGVDNEGAHLYPAFPYTSYRRMSVADVRDLWAYLRTLPVATAPTHPNDLGFPFNIRRGIGIWKAFYLSRARPSAPVEASDSAAFGRYLVQGPGHCGECHTPRDVLGGPIAGEALSGAPMPDGKGKAPNITPAGLKTWSQSDLELLLSSGITPEGDSVGGAMAEVVRNLGHLPKAYITAIARYLKAGD